ncbi:HdeD family acid-resistance protein [Thiocystis violacea]|uniref:HdeD family acid-resistance protein n=1 Tax=Thiocystis violacea TaxID=13725 RepID=UPI00190657B9|nr:DUF308 domain-containing protein [Thiocystis violacea]MBK1724806.1 hypothetical protein [Thiocystis violacea]
MSETTVMSETGRLFGALPEQWGWLVGFGILSTLLGLIGLGMTFGLTIAGVLLFGVLLAVGGGVQLFDAFKYRGWKSTLPHAAIAIIYLLAGGMMIVDPAGAAIALTLFLGVALIAAGVLRATIAWQHQGQRGWQWAAGGGVLSLLLGVVILIGWPVSGLWVIGLVIAVELLINGWTALFLGLAARRVKQEQSTAA